MGRRKAHHTHEVGDAYAEGWAAREKYDLDGVTSVNPYRLTVEFANKAKQSRARQESQQREIALWDEGWAACDADYEKDDLDEVTDFDFRHLSSKRD
jgi:hypothetical protein